jgi:hypothetical protein
MIQGYERTSVARLWQKILRTHTATLFGENSSLLLNRHDFDLLAQPGYVGHQYCPGGLLFVSMNPGGGSEGGRNADDLRQYTVLQNLRDADESLVVPAFDDLTLVLSDIMPRWKIYRNFVDPILHEAGIAFAEVSYLNLLKWRTKSSSGLARLYQLSWDDHTSAQIDVLAPTCVVAIGSDAGQWFSRRNPSSRFQYFDFIPRVIGNNVGNEGHIAIKRIVEKLNSSELLIDCIKHSLRG